MIKFYFLAVALVGLLSFNSLADELAVTQKNSTNSFLCESGFGGICRGSLHIISSPLLVPTALYFGIISPFKSDPELAGTTNYFLYSLEQIFVAPITITANTAVGAGGCMFETISGVLDVVSLGNYDLPEYDKHGYYDARPYFIQFAENGGSFTKQKQNELIAEKKNNQILLARNP